MRVSLVLVALLVGLFALPATAAAASCDLSTAVSPGHEITITGTGFDPAASVAITTTWSGSNATAGGNTGPQTTHDSVTSDAAGGFTFTIDAGPGHGGTYDIEATAAGCSTSTRVQALETAGGLNNGGTSATPPATDTAPVAADRGPGSGVPLALLLVAVALVAGLLALRRTARDADRRTR